MNTNQSLTQKQQNKQGYYLSQQHLKQMHLLHLSGFALHEYLANQLELNPALEIEHDDNDDDTEVTIENIEQATEWTVSDEDDLFRSNYQPKVAEEFYRSPVIQFNTLTENLKEQIHQMKLPTYLTQFACYLVDELNEDGYLRIPVNDVCDDYCFNLGKLVDEKEFEAALHIVQQCEPSGVGARDLRECLLLQLNNRIMHSPDNDEFNNAKIILECHYESFVQRDFSRIKSLQDLSEEELKHALHIIAHLRPRPLTEINRYELMNSQIIPDFETTIDNNELCVSLTQQDSSKLRVVKDFKCVQIPLANDAEKKQVDTYYSNLINDANSLVSALHDREATMLKVMSAIASIQNDFFRSGNRDDLKPMVLQDIANKTGYDISTVSRITSNKYVQTQHGIFLLKNLFMRNINGGIEHSTEHTAAGIQQAMKQLFDKEDKNSPLNDSDVVKELKKLGITIARRTVVKYREVLGIQNSKMRRVET